MRGESSTNPLLFPTPPGEEHVFNFAVAALGTNEKPLILKKAITYTNNYCETKITLTFELFLNMNTEFFSREK